MEADEAIGCLGAVCLQSFCQFEQTPFEPFGAATLMTTRNSSTCISRIRVGAETATTSLIKYRQKMLWWILTWVLEMMFAIHYRGRAKVLHDRWLLGYWEVL